MRLLVSVRNLAEALAVADSGVDFIDLKDPAAGALGALPAALTSAIVAALRTGSSIGSAPLLSATTGDLPSSDPAAILTQVAAVAATGVDYVKVGIDGGPGSLALLSTLARCQAAVVPVLLADRGVDMVLVEHALASGRFPALMLDTADKGAGSLLDRVAPEALAAFLSAVQLHRGTGTPAGSVPPTLAGLAGALRIGELPALQRLAPDFAGFRSAVCSSGRAGALDPERLQALCKQRASV